MIQRGSQKIAHPPFKIAGFNFLQTAKRNTVKIIPALPKLPPFPFHQTATQDRLRIQAQPHGLFEQGLINIPLKSNNTMNLKITNRLPAGNTIITFYGFETGSILAASGHREFPSMWSVFRLRNQAEPSILFWEQAGKASPDNRYPRSAAERTTPPAGRLPRHSRPECLNSP